MSPFLLGIKETPSAFGSLFSAAAAVKGSQSWGEREGKGETGEII